jgi:hypothetical protein
MGHILVRFPEPREVFIDGESQGLNVDAAGHYRVLVVSEGVHRVELGGPEDYTPAAWLLDVPATSVLAPLQVVFERERPSAGFSYESAAAEPPTSGPTGTSDIVLTNIDYRASAPRAPWSRMTDLTNRLGRTLGSVTRGYRIETAPRRHVNVAIVRSPGRAVVPKTVSLAPGTAYELRIDIGPLSPDSAVEDPEASPFPSWVLPPSAEGHWLEVIVVSDDFIVPGRRFHLFLPTSGASWVCDCTSGRAHSCRPRDRRPHLFIALKTPDLPGTARLRLGVYYAKNLIQSQLLVASIAGARSAQQGYVSHIDYTLTSDLTDLDALPPRTHNILTNENADGTHRIVINGQRDKVITFTLTEGQMRTSVDAVREALRNAHFVEKDEKRTSLLDETNAKKRPAFELDLERLAMLGWKLWTALLKGESEWTEDLGSPANIQVSRVAGTNFVFPWALVYDIPLESHAPHAPCELLDHWDRMPAIVEGAARRCPYEATHARKNVLCPFGFWGFRHVLEQPPSMPKGRTLQTSVRPQNQPPALAAFVSLRLDKAVTKQHVQALRGLGQLHVTDEASIDLMKQRLNGAVEVVYYYCHGGREPLAGTSQTTPYLEIGQDERFQPSDVSTWRHVDWPRDHWETTSPLVFINGCHTAEITPEALVTFVDEFAVARAAGVIGTEITIHQLLAGEAAEEFFRYFQAPAVTVGKALHLMRLRLLAKRNLLGLAYTPYCSGELHLAGA